MKINRNISQQKTIITKIHRQELHKNKSFVIWFTGLSGSGKTSIANKLEEQLHARGLSTYLLDGDHIRAGLNADLSFSEAGRKENLRRIGEVSKLMVDAGIITLSTFISPFIKERQMVRDLFEENEFIEVFVRCSLETCENRDPKGLYKKARKGEIPDFTGISSPYEPPVFPEIILDTDLSTEKECVDNIIAYLLKHHYISDKRWRGLP